MPDLETMTMVEVQLRLMRLERKLKHRVLYGEEGIDVCTHFVTVPEDSIEVLQKLISHTSGRMMLGRRCIAFEDGADATVFKLLNQRLA